MCLDSLFGGPSQGEQTAQAQESNLSMDLMANYQQQYAQQQDVLARLGAEVSRIQSGNTGPGFGGAENAALISGIVNSGAAAARNAIQASQDRSAGQVFNGQTDATGLARASAIRQQVAGDIAAKVGANTQNALIAENAANWAQGRATARESADLLSRQVGLYNPAAYASGASSATQSSFNMAQKIQQEKQQAAMSKVQFGVKLASMAAGGIMGGIGAGGGLFDTLKGVAGGVMGDSGMFLKNPTPAAAPTPEDFTGQTYTPGLG
jgi:hypothetical protein